VGAATKCLSQGALAHFLKGRARFNRCGYDPRSTNLAIFFIAGLDLEFNSYRVVLFTTIHGGRKRSKGTPIDLDFEFFEVGKNSIYV
jgi:hypothetical protein